LLPTVRSAGNQNARAYHALEGLRGLVHPNDNLATTLTASANANWSSSVGYVTGTDCQFVQHGVFQPLDSGYAGVVEQDQIVVPQESQLSEASGSLLLHRLLDLLLVRIVEEMVVE
jgi:hypothetical protein